MLKISAEQLESMRVAMRDLHVKEKTREIEDEMRSKLPEVTENYGEKLTNDISEALYAAERHEIDDPYQLYDWCVIRIVSKQPFYDMNEFADILDHPFFSPYAKARHIILSFFAIHALQQDGSSCARR